MSDLDFALPGQDWDDGLCPPYAASYAPFLPPVCDSNSALFYPNCIQPAFEEMTPFQAPSLDRFPPDSCAFTLDDYFNQRDYGAIDLPVDYHSSEIGGTSGLASTQMSLCTPVGQDLETCFTATDDTVAVTSAEPLFDGLPPFQTPPLNLFKPEDHIVTLDSHLEPWRCVQYGSSADGFSSDTRELGLTSSLKDIQTYSCDTAAQESEACFATSNNVPTVTDKPGPECEMISVPTTPYESRDFEDQVTQESASSPALFSAPLDHDGSSPYCERCRKSFSSPSSLHKHMKTRSHRSGPTSSRLIYRWRCSLCSHKEYVERRSLQRHKLLKHDGDKVHEHERILPNTMADASPRPVLDPRGKGVERALRHSAAKAATAIKQARLLRMLADGTLLSQHLDCLDLLACSIYTEELPLHWDAAEKTWVAPSHQVDPAIANEYIQSLTDNNDSVEIGNMSILVEGEQMNISWSDKEDSWMVSTGHQTGLLGEAEVVKLVVALSGSDNEHGKAK